jgi:hypothetical protein
LTYQRRHRGKQQRGNELKADSLEWMHWQYGDSFPIHTDDGRESPVAKQNQVQLIFWMPIPRPRAMI